MLGYFRLQLWLLYSIRKRDPGLFILYGIPLTTYYECTPLTMSKRTYLTRSSVRGLKDGT